MVILKKESNCTGLMQSVSFILPHFEQVAHLHSDSAFISVGWILLIQCTQ